jgi:hypothetical protein
MPVDPLSSLVNGVARTDLVDREIIA